MKVSELRQRNRKKFLKAYTAPFILIELLKKRKQALSPHLGLVLFFMATEVRL